MTETIVIKNPSPEFRKFVEGLKRKKEQQLKKLQAQKEAMFTIYV